MIPRFPILFCISLAVLTLVILSTRDRRPPAAPTPTPSPAASPEPSEAVIRIGLFTIGPEDEEPRLAGEFLVGVPGPFDLRKETRIPGEGPSSAQMSLGLGITTPSLLVPPAPEKTVALAVDTCKGSATPEKDGGYRLEIHVVRQRPGRSTGTTSSHSIRPSELVVLGQPGWGSSSGWWDSNFVLAHLETKSAGSWDLEAWRALITRQAGTSRDATRAAAWIPCPAARDALKKAADLESLPAARAMAGDVRGPVTFDQGWQPRTIWLKYPELRAAIEPELKNPELNEAPAGPTLVKKMPVGSASVSPPNQAYVTVFDMVPWAVAGALALAALLALLGPIPSVPAAAGAMAMGCLLAVSKFQVNWVNFPSLAALPFLLYGCVGLRRRLGSAWIHAAAVAACAIVGAQLFVLVQAPSWVARVGNLGYDVLPLLVLLAIEPLVGPGTGLTPRKALRGYAMTALLPTLAFIAVELIDTLAGRGAVSYTLATPLAIGFIGLNIASVYYGFGGFWSLRRRLNTLSSTTIAESAAMPQSQ